MPDNIKALRGYIKDRVLYGDSAFFATEDAESCADEIERLREENTYLQQIIKEYQRAMGFDEECSIALGEKEG